MDYMDWEYLKRCWRVEIMGGEDSQLSIRQMLRRVSQKEQAHYLFWFRLAQHLYRRPRGIINYRKVATRIQSRLLRTHGIDIMLGCEIGPGLRILHRAGIVIAHSARIGSNLTISQNTTIGACEADQASKIYVGDNVDIGANSCIIGDELRIGNNVTIGAMAFVDQDIPDDTSYHTRHVADVEEQDCAQIAVGSRTR
jgi:serine acetyltransferase